ncbi:hypothetical protein ACFU44_27310 [Nocardia rhizosphaerihabitans]|uniref:hypothetical protein n=1 Tax=Nocardia rhizosphaerihabitans TaxID=1691570 RepID=UPI00366F5108
MKIGAALGGAVLLGLTATVTDSVKAAPGWVKGQFTEPPPPLTLTGEMRATTLTKGFRCPRTLFAPEAVARPDGVLSEGQLGALLSDTKAGPISETKGDFVIQGHKDGGEIHLTDAEIVYRQLEPSTGTLIRLNPDTGGCGGPALEMTMAFGLGTEPHSSEFWMLMDDQKTRAPLDGLNYILTDDESLKLRVEVTTGEHDVEWQLRIAYSAHGQDHTLTIPEGDSWSRLYGPRTEQPQLDLFIDKKTNQWSTQKR